MTNEVFAIIKRLFAIIIAILCIVLSRYRAAENRKYADKYDGNTRLLLYRLLLTGLFKAISIIMLWGIITNKVDIFVAFYIFVPVLIALNLIFFNSEWMNGIMTFIKGIYYVGLIIISIIQFLLKNEDVGELALGFTIALAIFDCVNALSEGYSKM